MSLTVGPAEPLLPIAMASAVDDLRRGGERFRAECERLLQSAMKCDYVARLIRFVGATNTNTYDIKDALNDYNPAALLMITTSNINDVFSVITKQDDAQYEEHREATALSIAVLQRLYNITNRIEFVIHAILLWTGVDGLAPILIYLDSPQYKKLNIN